MHSTFPEFVNEPSHIHVARPQAGRRIPASDLEAAADETAPESPRHEASGPIPPYVEPRVPMSGPHNGRSAAGGVCDAAGESLALSDGRRLRVRPVRPDDAQQLVALFNRLSRESVRRRFFAAKHADPRQAAYFAGVDQLDRVALAAVTDSPVPEEEAIVAVARYDRTTADRAEVSVLVEDPYQGRGIGRGLFHRLLKVGRARGIRAFEAVVQADNTRALRLLLSSGYGIVVNREGDLLHGILALEPGPAGYHSPTAE
jgi:GNAT superfamily N-acetyltransferase